jgi:hypothetical protein
MMAEPPTVLATEAQQDRQAHVRRLAAGSCVLLGFFPRYNRMIAAHGFEAEAAQSPPHSRTVTATPPSGAPL